MAHASKDERITPDTSSRRALRYFTRAGEHGSSSFPDGLCRLRFEKIGLSTTFFTLDESAATPSKCTFFMTADVTGSRWHTANGLRVGATVASLRAGRVAALGINIVGH